MAIEEDYRAQAKAIVEEYLEASRILLTKRKSDGGVYGYAALLIMLCIIDAVGQSTEQTHGANLSILTADPFNLSDDVKDQITHWYRNGLCHVGAIPENILIELGEERDDPFEITSSEIKSVRLKRLHKIIASLWESQKENFNPGRIENKKSIGVPSEKIPNKVMSSLTTPSSGCSSAVATASGAVTIKQGLIGTFAPSSGRARSPDSSPPPSPSSVPHERACRSRFPKTARQASRSPAPGAPPPGRPRKANRARRDR